MAMVSPYDTNSGSYQICALLGECVTNIGTVYIARHIPTKSLVAIKKYHLENITREEVNLIQDEIILMRQLSHPNILPCYAAFVWGHEIVSVLPLMGYGSCSNIIARHFATGIPEPAIACILKSVLHALVYLHSKGIIHRAIRASHILISAEGNVSLCGLRYSCNLVHSGKRKRKLHSFPPSTHPNLNWLSPELLQQNLEGYNEKCDVYSLGVTACELANGVVPFWDTETTLMLTEKVRGAAPQLLDSTTFVHMPSTDGDECGAGEISDECVRQVSQRRFSDNFHYAAEMCMELDVESRPSPVQLLSHAFFKSAPPPAALPSLLMPAIPILDTSLPEVQDDLEALMAAEKLSNMDINSVSWDF